MTFADIIDSWPGGAAGFARDIGIVPSHARVMRKRDSIDSKYWQAVVSAAKRHKLSNVTYARLAEIAAEARNGESTT